MRPPAPETSLSTVGDVSAPAIRENWQDDAYSFTEAIGEVGYVLNLKANMLGRCRIRPEVRKPGTDEWEETSDPRVLRVLNAFKPPEGDQGELLRQGALHYEIAGEAYLFGQPILDEHKRPAGLLWEFLSTLELKVEKGGKVIRNAWGGSQGKHEVEVDAYVARLHHRDPRFSQRTDCPMRRVLPICRELVLLTQVIDAIAKSRIPAGLFYVPWEVSFGPENEWENPGENAESGLDEFEEELAKHLQSAIEDRTAAASLIPLLMRGPAFIKDKPAKDLIGFIDITRELDNLYKELREEALKRLADGLDIEPEMMSGKSVLSGLGGGNVALSIDANFLANHVVPLGEKLVGFCTTAYCRPMLATFEDMTPAEAEWFRFALDPSALAADTDLSDNATTGYNLDVVSEEAWVRYNGLDEGDMPDEDEQMRRTLTRLLYAQPTLGPSILPVLYPNNPALDKALENWDVGQSVPGGVQFPFAELPAKEPPSIEEIVAGLESQV